MMSYHAAIVNFTEPITPIGGGGRGDRTPHHMSIAGYQGNLGFICRRTGVARMKSRQYPPESPAQSLQFLNIPSWMSTKNPERRVVSFAMRFHYIVAYRPNLLRGLGVRSVGIFHILFFLQIFIRSHTSGQYINAGSRCASLGPPPGISI